MAINKKVHIHELYGYKTKYVNVWPTTLAHVTGARLSWKNKQVNK